MVSASSDGMETDEDKKKKINDDVVVFLGKRSETDAPRYSARLKTYVTLQQKRRRASAARRHSEYAVRKKRMTSGSRKKIEPESKDKNVENTEQLGEADERRKARGGDGMRKRSLSRSGTGEPSDACCGRRRRRSCGRRKRRRRSGRRRRRRSRSRRRRRRSCRRRRRRRRRCR
ncbi:protamine-like [Achroia grisella]|uniref:protamine-like n=1 Tax=Achroia grisella TaxID=688607 RepID=UPI0027D2ED21|nr:protamine-like [Achroia grisella]